MGKRGQDAKKATGFRPTRNKRLIRCLRSKGRRRQGGWLLGYRAICIDCGLARGSLIRCALRTLHTPHTPEL